MRLDFKGLDESLKGNWMMRRYLVELFRDAIELDVAWLGQGP